MKTRYILQEERGIAMFPYKEAIDDIFEYISDYVMDQVDTNRKYETNYRYGKISRYEYERNVKHNINFCIPEYLIVPFDFVSELEIIVYAKQGRNNEEDVETGKFSYYGDASIDANGKLNCGIITLKCNYDYRDGSLYERSMYNTLYHEFNHMYLLWQQLKTSKLEDTGKFKIRRQLYNKKDNKFNSEFKNEYFENLTYRLFNFDELNSLVASVYGDLKQTYYQCDIKPNFRDAVKKSQAYEEYEYFHNYMNTFVDSLTDNEVSFIKSYFKKKIFL